MSFAFHAVNMGRELSLQELFSVHYNVKEKGSIFCGYTFFLIDDIKLTVKVKVILQQVKVAQGVPGGLRPQIFLTFGTARVVGRQPYAPAAFTPGEIPGTHFSEAESTPGQMVPSGATEKNRQ